MKKTKIQKGITLVALIITIVVLLILAVVTIGAIQESDIIKYATDASNEHIIGQEKEQIKLAYDSYKISLYTPTDQDLLEKYFLGANKQGLDLFTLVDEDNSTDTAIKFKDIDITITQSDVSISDDGKYIYMLFNYNNNKYKLTAEMLDDNLITKKLELYKREPILVVEGAKVVGKGEPAWGITFYETNNKYTLNADGTIEEKEFDNWIIAWVSDGTKWSTIEYSNGDEITEEYTIIAKLYETGEMATPVCGGMTMPTGKTYSLKIEGTGTMPGLEDSKNQVTYAWLTGMYQVNTSEPNIYMYITEVEISEGIENIPDAAFAFGYSLKEIKFPTTIKSIGVSSFVYCSSLEKMILPSNVTYIGKTAFGVCMNLKEITIPESVTSIASDAFYECRELKTIYYNGTATGKPWGARNATVQTY